MPHTTKHLQQRLSEMEELEARIHKHYNETSAYRLLLYDVEGPGLLRVIDSILNQCDRHMDNIDTIHKTVEARIQNLKQQILERS